MSQARVFPKNRHQLPEGGRGSVRIRSVVRSWARALALLVVLPWLVLPGRPTELYERFTRRDSVVVIDRSPAALHFCWEQFEGLGDESAAALKLEVSYKSPAANDKFIDEAVLKEPPEGGLFLHVDNVMMKELNDHLFRDKGLSAATESLWTRVFFEMIDKDVRTGVAGAEQPWLKYSDYKTIRVGFRKTSPELEAWLAGVFRRASRQFSRELAEFDYVDGLIRQYGGVVAAQPVKWHLGGIGRSPGEAAAASRAGRYHHPGAPGASRSLVDARSPELQRQLAENLESLEEMRKRLQTEAMALFKNKPPFLELVPETKDTYVLSREVFDIFKRLDEVEGEQFLEEVNRAFRRRFERRFPDLDDLAWSRLLHDMHAYYKAVDPFMPPIYERDEVMDLGFGSAKHGIVSYDLAGAGRDNIAMFMGQMARTAAIAKARRLEGKPLEPAELVSLGIHRAKVGQGLASRRFQERRERFIEAVRELGIPGRIVRSGDEVLFYPDRPLEPQERERLAALLAKRAPPDDGRMGFLPPTYRGTTQEIPAAKRAAFLGFSEALEKNLRLDLELSGDIPRSRLVRIGIAVDLEAADTRAGTVRLILTGDVSASDKLVIEDFVRSQLPEGFVLGQTRTPVAP